MVVQKYRHIINSCTAGHLLGKGYLRGIYRRGRRGDTGIGGAGRNCNSKTLRGNTRTFANRKGGREILGDLSSEEGRGVW